MPKISSRVLITTMFLYIIGVPGDALAYLDPGSGSIILQLLLGGIAGVVMVLKLYWESLVGLFRRKKREQGDIPRSELHQ